MEKITLTPQGGETIELYVLEQTRLGGVNYLLTTDEETEDGEAYILKEVFRDGQNISYEFVEDDAELDAMGTVFASLLEDEEIDLV
ncbi:MAG: DUF1292 domain-containing protein [Lachnospiraceae bacterium]|nr:DUF1292 domain-containing protein [Lachnospiraceae bacterium]